MHHVSGVGKGGYDCNAGASNWIQGWLLGEPDPRSLFSVGIHWPYRSAPTSSIRGCDLSEVDKEEGLVLQQWPQPVLRQVPLPWRSSAFDQSSQDCS